MGVLLSGADLCTEALSIIGKASVYERAPDKAILTKALRKLDLLVSHVEGAHRLWHVVPNDQIVPILAGQQTYDLNQILSDRLMVVDYAWLRIFNTSDQTRWNDYGDVPGGLKLGRRWEYEVAARNQPAYGNPCVVYVDGKADAARMFIDRVPQVPEIVPPATEPDLTTNLAIVLRGSMFSPNIDQAGPVDATHEFPVAMQSWLIHALAYDLGNGPITTLEERRLTRIEKDRERLWNELMRWSNREKAKRARFTTFRRV